MHCTANACTDKLILAKQVQTKNCCTVRSVIYRKLKKITSAQHQFRIPVSYGHRQWWEADLLIIPQTFLCSQLLLTHGFNTESYLCICEFCLSDPKCDTKLRTALKPNCPQHRGPTVIQLYLAKIPTCEIYCYKTQASVTGNRFSHYEEVSTEVVSQ